jgi:hypothetical protein
MYQINKKLDMALGTFKLFRPEEADETLPALLQGWSI